MHKRVKTRRKWSSSKKRVRGRRIKTEEGVNVMIKERGERVPGK